MSADVQKRLDDEIATMTLMLRDLCTQRNALSPVSRLPPEILASIFVHCACSRQKNRWGIPDWVNVSYVCRHWRKVALNCSALWSFLFVSSERWTDELFARSKAAPLKVCVDFPYPNPCHKELYLLGKVASQASDRVQALRLRFLVFADAESVLSLLSAHAPLLQTLQISVETGSRYLEASALPLSRVPFDGRTGTLRKLELTNYAFPLTSPTLCGLTSLTLRDFRVSFQPTIASLKDALGQMQDLVHLHLENALPSARTIDQFLLEDPQRLKFPKLTRLLIVAPFTTVVLLLSCFDIPLKTEVRLRCCFEANAEDHTPIYPLLAKRFLASEDQTFDLAPVIRTCFIEATSATVSFIFSTAERGFRYRAFSVYTTSYDPVQLNEDWDRNMPLKVDIVLRSSLSRDREDLVGGICHHVPLTNLQSAHFTFDTRADFSSGFWTRTFGHLQELQAIRLSGVNLQGFIQSLSPSLHLPRDTSGNLQSGPIQTFSPTLKELELHKAPFAKVCDGQSLVDPNRCVCSVQCLHDALSNRQAEGHALQRLVLVECVHVLDHDVECLKNAVTDVDWDGVARTIPTLESDDEDSAEDLDDRPSGRFGITRLHAFT